MLAAVVDRCGSPEVVSVREMLRSSARFAIFERLLTPNGVYITTGFRPT